MPRAPRRLLALLALAAGCASAPPPLPPGVTPAPAVGDSLELLLAKLRYAEGAPASVSLRELRVVALEREPWQSVPPEAAAAQTGPLGVIAGRRCRWRDGLSFHSVERGSWYVFESGALRAFDHRGFGAACAERPAFEPVAAGEVALERSLVRYLSQRFPPSEVRGEERLARGLRLLARGRDEDAAYELHALDRRLQELERRQTEQETPDPAERERLRHEEEQLRPLRAQLFHALAEAERKTEAQP